MNPFEDDDAAWRRCEIAWAEWLTANGYIVTRLTEAGGNERGTKAPLINVGSVKVRAPDFQTLGSGKTEFWEVKYRTSATFDPVTGVSTHWIERAAFDDYLVLTQSARVPVVVVLYEAPTAVTAGRWLRADVERISASGTSAQMRGRGGVLTDAWAWPVAAMEPIDGPKVHVPREVRPVFVEEGDGEGAEFSEYVAAERAARSAAADVPFIAQAMRDDAMAGLEVLHRKIGIPDLPRYSVTWIGRLEDATLTDLAALLEYGIRVFLITPEPLDDQLAEMGLTRFELARMLEHDQTELADGMERWIVDGRIDGPDAGRVRDVLAGADSGGRFNSRQYAVVHADRDSSVLITAGAGTGKTETMVERIIFLLATDPRAAGRDLRLDDLALVTFTREAAGVMRSRIARTLILRQRLSPRCVFPVLAWLTQLSHTRISTIHNLALSLVESAGGALGLGPDFKVSQRVVQFHDAVTSALSPHLVEHLRAHPTVLPPVHEWRKHVESVWETMEGNGMRLYSMAGATLTGPKYGALQDSTEPQRILFDVTSMAIDAVAQEEPTRRREDQTLPTDQLVPTAHEVLSSADSEAAERPAFLFVDEFQDTDALQMRFLLDYARFSGAQLFVVGDAKQGIYRFRGAQGNAFDELRQLVSEGRAGLPGFEEFGLVKNFRTGEALLNSFHRLFSSWGTAGLLTYEPSDRLTAGTQRDRSQKYRLYSTSATMYADDAATEVAHWWQVDKEQRLAVLCRINAHAIEVQRHLRQLGVPCELAVGGDFFRTPMVLEFRALLEAVVSPWNRAAILELVETRWTNLVCGTEVPIGLTEVESRAWVAGDVALLPWVDRVASVASSSDFAESDLRSVRTRVEIVGQLARRIPAMAWVSEMLRAFRPERCSLGPSEDPTELPRYLRCADHLVTLLDSTFGGAPVTLGQILEWVRLQIAVNRSEDEPNPTGNVWAITVHKAKGLEFDRVVIPHTWREFGPARAVTTRSAVVVGAGGEPEVIWDWKTPRGHHRIGDAGSWNTDSYEVRREETRLLYVAMTRAKLELAIAIKSSARADTWQGLLEIGRRS